MQSLRFSRPKPFFVSLLSQIKHLMPCFLGSAEEWTGGTQESYDVINALYQAFVDTVRSSGGSNKDRTLVVSTYAQSVEKNAVGGLVVPKDDHVIVSLHIYAPWNFCGPDDTRADWGSDADKQELDTTSKIRRWS